MKEVIIIYGIVLCIVKRTRVTIVCIFQIEIQKINSRNGKIRSCKEAQLISNNLVLFIIKKNDNLTLLIFVFKERT